MLPFRDPQHPDVHLLRKIGGVRAPPHAPEQERLQRPAMFREQPLDQVFFASCISRPGHQILNPRAGAIT